MTKKIEAMKKVENERIPVLENCSRDTTYSAS